MHESTQGTWKSARQVLAIAALWAIGYALVHTLRTTAEAMNWVFVYAWLALPFLAIRPVIRMQRQPKIWGFILLTPVLLVSGFLLMGTVVFYGLLGPSENKEPLQTFQEGSSTIELQRYENGGGVGVHGLNLEQRRFIVPGLYLVRSVGFFDDAREGTLSQVGPFRVKVHAKGSYYSNDYEVDKSYTLKPWVYF
jgi:hypothetical protein